MSISAKRFEHLLEAVTDALVGMDQKGIIRFVNVQAESLFGYDRDELVGQPIDMLVPEARRQLSVDHNEDYLADPRTRSSGLDVELNGRHHNGGEFPIHVSMSSIDTGDVLLVIAGGGDIATQQRAVRNAGLVEAIVEHSDDAIVGLTIDGIVTSWNPAAERMYGYSPDEVIGRSDRMIPQERAGELEAVLALVRDGHIKHTETELARKDGTMVPVSITAAPIRDEAGTVIGVSTVHRDVTEQKKAFEATQRMAAIVENSEDAIISGSLDGSITSWNPAAERLYGYSGEEIIGKPATVLAPADRAGEMRAVRDKIMTGQHVKLETQRVRKDGTVFPILLSVSPARDTDGAVIGTSVIHRDLTAQKRAEQAVVQDRDLLRATMDSLMDPHVLLEPVRDEAGQVVDFMFADANLAACEYAGKTYDELIGMRLPDLFHDGAQPDSLVDQCSRVLETGEPLVLDDTVYIHELMGRESHFDIRVARVRDALSYSWRDVTDRHAAAQWLAESEEHFRLLAENASDVVMRLSPDGRFEWVSGSIADVLGWAAPDLLGHMVGEFVHPDELALSGHAIVGSSAKKPVSTEFRFRRSDGSYRWVLCHTRLKVDPDGAPVALVGGLVDIEVRKEVEAQEMDRLETLERFQRLTVGRELRMIELKKEIETLRSLVHKDGDEGRTHDPARV